MNPLRESGVTHFGVLSTTDFQLNGEVPAVGLTLNESAEQILKDGPNVVNLHQGSTVNP